MLPRVVVRGAFIAGVLVSISFAVAAAGIVRTPIVSDYGWYTGPDYYAGENARLMARYLPGTPVRTYATGKIHNQNASYDWVRESCDIEHFSLTIVGAEQPHWEVLVCNDFSLDVQGTGIGSSLFVQPGHWWKAEGTHSHYCQIQGVVRHQGGAKYIVASDYPDETSFFYVPVTPDENIILQKKTKADGQLKKDPEWVSSLTTVPGATVFIYFNSKTEGGLRAVPYSPTQLQSVSLDINMAADAYGVPGEAGTVGKYWGIAIAYDGEAMIGVVDIP